MPPQPSPANGTRLSTSSARSASRAVVPSGRPVIAPSSEASSSPARSKNSSSLLPKWLKIVLTDTSAASAIWASVTASNPRSMNSRVATSEMAWRSCRFLRTRRPSAAAPVLRGPARQPKRGLSREVPALWFHHGNFTSIEPIPEMCFPPGRTRPRRNDVTHPRHRSDGPAQALRRHARARRHRPRGARGLRLRPPRSQRRRQDHRRAHPHHARPPPTPARPASRASTSRRDPKEVRRRIGLAAQDATVDGLLTGRENLVMIGELHHLGRSVARSRAPTSCSSSSTSPTPATSSPRTTPAACAAGSTSPPRWSPRPRSCSSTSRRPGLDPRARNELWDVLTRSSPAGTTLLLTTQYLEEADRLADDIVVVDHGRVIARGDARQLKRAGRRRPARASSPSTPPTTCDARPRSLERVAGARAERRPRGRAGSPRPPTAAPSALARWPARCRRPASRSRTSACASRRSTTCS